MLHTSVYCILVSGAISDSVYNLNSDSDCISKLNLIYWIICWITALSFICVNWFKSEFISKAQILNFWLFSANRSSWLFLVSCIKMMLSSELSWSFYSSKCSNGNNSDESNPFKNFSILQKFWPNNFHCFEIIKSCFWK